MDTPSSLADVVQQPRVCPHCTALFPDEWPSDFVLASRALAPVDAARHLLTFTRIVHGNELPKRHRGCLLESAEWLRRVKDASRRLRLEGLDAGMFDLWLRLLDEALLAVRRELSDRAERPMADWSDIAHGFRTAMNSVGWRDWHLETEPAASRVTIRHPGRDGRLMPEQRSEFERRLRNMIGGDVAEGIEIRYKRFFR